MPRSLGTRLRDLPVHRLGAADLAACSDLAQSRGWGREEHKWRLLLTSGQGYGVEAPDRPGTLIGACVLTSYGPLPPTVSGAGLDPGTGAACVGMMLVAERCERQGLGRRLLEHAVAEAGDALLFLYATDNGRPLYERLGFRAAGTVTSLRGRLPASDGESDAADGSAPYVRPATATDLPAVRALDAHAFGADRGQLLDRLPRFADGLVVADAGDGSLRGFGAAWPNGPGGTVVGPVVALDTATAQALVRDLGEHTAGDIRLDIDGRHEGLETWARRHGLEGSCLCTRMIHGSGSGSRPLGDASRRFAPYSVALG
ncbi:GNAT family N-acetyltransferase [Streptomyces bathyalis]|uniref:GNAT family N-acetyltransferase n=1 Tax=Streptomyces bathyalis TaxID=2710756 RepID=A0A7T1TD98_9ACTN|nr:GNAT family N-acetyltransferase [Streptomyces bathyalis]